MTELKFARMRWFKVLSDSAGVYDARELNESHGYHLDHSPRNEPPRCMAGLGWEISLDPYSDLRRVATLRDHVMVLENDGLYLSLGVLRTLGVNPSYLDEGYVLRVGAARFIKLTENISEEIRRSINYERRTERERFVQQRNAGLFNALLGLAQEYKCQPWMDKREVS